MRGLSWIAALGLWAATIVVAFAIGRNTSAPGVAPAPEDLGAAMRSALAEGDALERTAQTVQLLEHLDPETLPGVVAVYDQSIEILDEQDIRPFITAWTRFDPAGALDHALTWPHRKREAGVDAAIYGWAQRDPLSARLAAAQVASDYPALAETALFRLFAGWIHSGQDGLDRHILELPTGAQDSAIGVAIGALMRKGGADATLAWASAILQDESYGDRFKLWVFRRATRSVARSDPERGAAWALQHAGNDYAIDGPRLVAEQWSEQDGLAAIEWLRDQPESEQRDRAVRDAFLGWLRSDPQSARAWLEGETLTPFHDQAIDVFAKRLADRKPVQAIAWCEHITDPKRRNGCLKVAASGWYQRDAVAAEAWLQDSPLDEEMRSQVRELPEQRRRRPGGARPRAAQGAGS